ncbi:cell division ATP-binding protein FtsE [Candidatus Saccharibacteria bacterium]|nr:cell division ATP-binding protein FtsE [Candidatus Saccharibacteria bacterium]
MILLDRVTKFYPGDSRPALDHVSLHIEPNEFVFLVGKSGAGKSTLMKMITKEESPDKGKIIIGGIDLDYVKRRYVPHYRRRLGVVFQDFKLLPGRTVYENVAFALEIAGMSNAEIEKTVPKVLDLVGLAGKEKKFPDNLSGGEQQRVSIARSVARQPKILIADEPSANLDTLTTKEIVDLLQKINDFGTTVLVTTHDENIVNHLHRRVVTMKDGKIVSDQKNNGVYRLDKIADRDLYTPANYGFNIQTPRTRINPTAAFQKTATAAAHTATAAKNAATNTAERIIHPTARPTPRRNIDNTQNLNLVVDSTKLKPTPTLKARPRKFRSGRKVI